MNRLKIIGVEEHVLTPAIRDRFKGLPYEVRGILRGDETLQKLVDVGEQRLRDMDAMGVDVQVLSVTSPATQVLEPSDALALAREANELLADVVSNNPERYHCFATLPTPSPAAAVDELERCVKELGHRGVMLHGRTGEKLIDHPDFAGILDKAAELQVPVHLHPQRPVKTISDYYYMEGLPEIIGKAFSTAAWGWHVETAVNAIRLLLSGAFDRSPGLQIILGHWGEMIPFFLERIDESFTRLSNSAFSTFQETFLEHFHLAPAGMWSYPMLTNALAVVGADRILFSSDYPFIDSSGGSARRFLEDAPISPSAKEKIGHLNAERLLKLAQ